jgi:formylglycine-generating enzyme required for sulfatase activity
MTEYDILFWLLVLLLGAVAFTIEAGVATRHRKLVLTSLFSIMLSTLYIMFLVEDKSSFNFGPRPGPLGNGGGGGERGAFKFNNKGPDSVSAMDGGSGDQGGGSGSGKDGKGRPVTYRTGIFEDCPHCPSMVVVPNGKVLVGATKDDPDRQPNETPQKPIVFAKPFAVSRSEVTRKEFAAFIQATNYAPSKVCSINDRRVSADWKTPGIEQGERHPVVCVSWQDAKAYVGWLRSSTRRPYRLMSESEWEYVAHAGTMTPYWFGAKVDEARANYAKSRRGTMATGEGTANPFGLFDVHGNVWEIVDDCYGPDPSYMPGDGRPANLLGDCGQRVVKGGGWDSRAEQLRVAFRSTAGEQAASNTLGFRIARDLDDQDVAR